MMVRELAVAALARELLPSRLLEAGLPDRLRCSPVWAELVARHGTAARAAAALLQEDLAGNGGRVTVDPLPHAEGVTRH